MILGVQRWGDLRRRSIILLHGRGNAWTTWDEVGPALERRGLCAVAVSLRGHLGSRASGLRCDLADLASDVADTMDATYGKREAIAIVGHSLGSIVAMEIVRQRRLAVRCLILEDPPELEHASIDDLIEQFEDRVRRAQLDPDVFAAELLATNPWMRPARARETTRSVGAVQIPVLNSAMKSLQGVDLTSIARAMTLPTLLLLARGQPQFQPARSGDDHLDWASTLATQSALVGSARTRFIRALPHVTVRTFDTGHAIHSEAQEEFVSAIALWLKTVERADSG